MISMLKCYQGNDMLSNIEKMRERKISSYRAYSNSKSYKQSELTFFLNKALNNNVKSYVYELSANFNELKNISNSIYEKLYYNTYSEKLPDNIKTFTSTYNRFIGFLNENISNSPSFKGILDNVTNFINQNVSTLKKLGVKIQKNGFLDTDFEEDLEISRDLVEDKNIQNFYNSLYNKLCDFMKEPLSNHMEFKEFSYYFNYSGDYNKNKSFKIIEQGLLVDIAL